MRQVRRGILAAAGCVVLLSGCATVPAQPDPPNPIAAAERSQIHLDKVDIVWAVDPASTGKADVFEAEKPDFATALQTIVTSVFAKPGKGQGAKGVAPGPEPVTFKIVVTQYSGVANVPDYRYPGTSMTADAHVIRESDQVELGVYKDVSVTYSAGGGLIGIAVAKNMKHFVHKDVAGMFAYYLKTLYDRA